MILEKIESCNLRLRYETVKKKTDGLIISTELGANAINCTKAKKGREKEKEREENKKKPLTCSNYQLSL